MAHVFDLASNWTDGTAIMIFQGWYSLPDGDGGADYDYGVWNPGNPQAWHAGNPSAYPYHPYALQDATLSSGGHRFIGSKLRPLTGLYSDAGRNAESIAAIDRHLEIVPRDGDPRARVDVCACTLGHIAFTSYGGYEFGDDDYQENLDNRYLFFVNMLARAEAAGLENCVMFNYEAYYIWQYNSDVYTTKAARLYAMALDIQGLVVAQRDSSAGFKVDGRPVIMFYRGTLGETITNAEWDAVFEEVRKPFDAGGTPFVSAGSPAGTNTDFYVLALSYASTEFNFADGLFPWISHAEYTAAAGDTHREKSANWVRDAMAPINVKLNTGSFPGRIGLGNFSPGMDDWVLGWGSGDTTRVIPRNTDTINGALDGYNVLDGEGDRPAGFLCVTWNGYPEGHCFEPTVEAGAEYIGTLTEVLGEWKGDTVSADDTAALRAIWENAAGVSSATSPVTPRQGGPQAFSQRISKTGLSSSTT